MAFFASPAKPALRKALEQRAAKAGVVPAEKNATGTNPARKPLPRTASTDSLQEPILGLSVDPERDVDEAVKEIRREVQARRASIVKKGL